MSESRKQTRVGVIFGGRSGEHEVSLMSAQSVLSALDPAHYAVTQIGITHEGTWLTGPDVLQSMLDNHVEDLVPVTLLPDPSHPGLYGIQDTQHGELLELLTALDVVFPVLHGTYGEDGTLQGLLEMTDVAYVGAGVLGSALGMDKGVFRDVMAANGIPVLENVVILRSELKANPDAAMNRAEAVAHYPLFVKPANLGSSVGITKVRSRSDLLEGLLEAARYDRRVLVQRGVNAREIEVSVLGNDKPEASVPGEVIPSREFYSYESKYFDGTSQLIIPAPINAKTAERVRRLAVKAYKAIDGAGLARVDFLLDKDTSNVYLNEINTMPGFTQISMYPKLWDVSGLPYPALVTRLIELALERKADRDQTERRFRR
jgi:D-alanine-D-alanine ligase